jgi:TATA-binding protein-associated factor
MSNEESEHIHYRYLTDLALKICCIFALDRFADFVGDQVKDKSVYIIFSVIGLLWILFFSFLILSKMVVPVRESCAQALGAVSKFLDEATIFQILAILSKLQSNPLWEVRHGGLLGTKYLIAVRMDIAPKILPMVADSILSALKDSEDEVRAIAAESLIPVICIFVKVLPERISQLLSCLWDSLLVLDDLTASTSSIMDLLAKLNSESDKDSKMLMVVDSFDDEYCMKKLCSFLRHPLTTVRISTLRTINSMISMHSSKLSDDLIVSVFRLLFRNFLLEDSEIILKQTDEAWSLFIISYLTHIDQLKMGSLLDIIFTLLGWPLDLKFNLDLFSDNSGGGDVMHEEDKESNLVFPDPSIISKDTLVQNRLMAARAAGRLFGYLFELKERIFTRLSTFLHSSSYIQRCIGSVIFQHWVYTSSVSGALIDFQETRTSILTILQNEEDLDKSVIFNEAQPMLTRMKEEYYGLQNILLEFGLSSQHSINWKEFRLNMTTEIVNVCETWLSLIPEKIKKTVEKECSNRQEHILSSLSQFREAQESLYISVMGALSSAFVMTGELPTKLNVVIRSLMNSLKVLLLEQSILLSYQPIII